MKIPFRKKKITIEAHCQPTNHQGLSPRPQPESPTAPFLFASSRHPAVTTTRTVRALCTAWLHGTVMHSPWIWRGKEYWICDFNHQKLGITGINPMQKLGAKHVEFTSKISGGRLTFRDGPVLTERPAKKGLTKPNCFNCPAFLEAFSSTFLQKIQEIMWSFVNLRS
jgi:hypothetical protein